MMGTYFDSSLYHRAYYLKISWEFAYYHKIADPPPHPGGGFDTGICPKPGKSSKNTENTLFFRACGAIFGLLSQQTEQSIVLCFCASMPSPSNVTIITKKTFSRQFRYVNCLYCQSWNATQSILYHSFYQHIGFWFPYSIRTDFGKLFSRQSTGRHTKNKIS